MTERVKVEAVLDDRVSSGVSKISDSLKGVGAAAGSVGKVAGPALAGVGAAAGAVAGALGAAMSVVVGYADEMNELAKSAGVGVEAFSRLAHVAKLSDVGMDDMARAMGRMSRAVADGDPLISRLVHGAQTADEAFLRVAAAVAGANDEVTRQQIAYAAFGRQGQALLPMLTESADELERMMASAPVVSAEMAEMANAFADQMTHLSQSMRAALLPIAQEVLPWLTRELERWISGARVILGGVQRVAGAETEPVRLQRLERERRNRWQTVVDRAVSMQGRMGGGMAGARGMADADPEVVRLTAEIARLRSSIEAAPPQAPTEPWHRPPPDWDDDGPHRRRAAAAPTGELAQPIEVDAPGGAESVRRWEADVRRSLAESDRAYREEDRLEALRLDAHRQAADARAAAVRVREEAQAALTEAWHETYASVISGLGDAVETGILAGGAAGADALHAMLTDAVEAAVTVAMSKALGASLGGFAGPVGGLLGGVAGAIFARATGDNRRSRARVGTR